MGSMDDITKKATDFLQSDKAQEALKGQKAEDISDKLLDGVADLTNKVTKGAHADKVESARDAADKKIGTDS